MAPDERIAFHAQALTDIIEIRAVIAPVADRDFDDLRTAVAEGGYGAQRGQHLLLGLVRADCRDIETRDAALDPGDALEPLPGRAQMVGKRLRRARIGALGGDQVVAA